MYARHLGESVDDLLCHAVAEVLVFRVGTHVGERQHGYRGRRGFLLPRTKLGLESLAERTEGLAFTVLAPAIEIGGVNSAEIDRQAGVVESNRHQHATVGPVARLAPDPARIDRTLRPHDNQRLRLVELAGDQRVEFLARRDRRVPPDRPTLGFKRGDERSDKCFVVSRIRDENIGHRLPPYNDAGL